MAHAVLFERDRIVDDAQRGRGDFWDAQRLGRRRRVKRIGVDPTGVPPNAFDFEEPQ
jgi:hypothetical protein